MKTALQTVTHIFLDDGGVLNDNERRGAEWRQNAPMTPPCVTTATS